jgi:hypothetical protein
MMEAERAITRHDIKANVAFNVHYPTQKPLLNVADYFCWAVQRVFEKGETRYYDYMKEQISVVIDVYDTPTTSKTGKTTMALEIH